MIPLIGAVVSQQSDEFMYIESPLRRMTLEQKLDLIGGTEGFYIRAIPEANLPRLKMADGPVGVRNDGPTTAYPAGFTLAATWDADLARRFGTAIGRDSRARGVHIWLGPGVNLARVQQNGRNFEYLGEDPYLAGRMATEIVKGVEGEGVAATVKHYAGNEHESDRNNDDSIIDERTLRELYIKPFEMVVRDANPSALMTSYNLVNGSHASENRHLITDILKGEWGYDGIVMSDWGSVYSAKGPYENGLDLEMPDARWMNRKNLQAQIESGALSVEILNDKVRRILRVAHRLKWANRPQKDPSISLDDPQNAAAAMQVAREGMVLLKNQGGVLPLKGKRILVVGPNADPAVTGGGGSAYTTPNRSVSVRQALERLAPAGTTVDYMPGFSNPSLSAATTVWTDLHADYFAGRDLRGTPVLSRTETHIDNRWRGAPGPGVPEGNFSVRWKGRFTPTESGEAFLTASMDDGMRVTVDGKRVIDEWHDQAEATYTVPLKLTAGTPIDVTVEYYQGAGDAVARVGIAGAPVDEIERNLPKSKLAGYDAVVACVGFTGNGKPYEGEGSDRSWNLPAEQEAMLRRLVSLNKHVVVVLNAGAGVATKAWIGQAAGFVHAGYPGGEGNLALAEILYGKTSPQGKLPTSFPADLAGTYYADAYPSKDRTMVYREGPFIGYRWFDRNGAKPLYPFGYGLSYTKFALSKPSVSTGDTVTVRVAVKNTGRMAGAETVQVYAEPPKGPIARAPRELRAFAKASLAPGESQVLTMSFAKKDLARYDVAKKAWVVDPGVYRLRVGTSSRDLPITLPVNV